MSDPKSSKGALLAELKEEYLNLIATWLLEEWRATEDDLTRETDTPYTRGTTRFGRQKERITQEYASRRQEASQRIDDGTNRC